MRVLSAKADWAEADNTLRDLHNSSDDTKAEFNNCFIVHSKSFQFRKKVKIDVTFIFNCLFIGNFRR